MITTIKRGKFDFAKARVRRAEQAIPRLAVSIDEFTNSQFANFRTDGRYRSAYSYITIDKLLPISIVLDVSDIIHNLRVALDYCVFEISDQYDKPPPPSKTYFPISASETEYEAQLRKMTWAQPTLISALRSLRVWEGGDRALLVRLHKLNLIDKHRAVVDIDASAIISGIDDVLIDDNNQEIRKRRSPFTTNIDYSPNSFPVPSHFGQHYGLIYLGEYPNAPTFIRNISRISGNDMKVEIKLSFSDKLDNNERSVV